MCGLGGRSGKQADNVTARKTVYVGFTRALDELSVVTTADNVFAGDLRREGSVDGRSGGA
jgi:hypothetical protein